MKNYNNNIHLDNSQQRIVEQQQGYHLVLAAPGCGKTQILTERIKEAYKQGVKYDDMLCLTFTNRAARGMVERIKNNIEDTAAENVYVGNVHRFCSKFLFENKLIPSATSVIDDEDAISILAGYVDEDEHRVMEDYKRKKLYNEIIFLSHLISQIAHQHPKELRLHPECLYEEDVTAIKKICEIQSMEFNGETLYEIYRNAQLYEDIALGWTHDYGTQCLVLNTLRRMKMALYYEQYKHTNKLVDFEDLLIMTYNALMHAPQKDEWKRYAWIQVDEVQDLNSLQLAIIDAITLKNKPCVMYLGDEQQAIFSFMGAKVSTLNSLRERCGENIHHLAVNHRSPKYLLDVFNKYAEKVLRIDTKLLPQAGNANMGNGNELAIIQSEFIEEEYKDVAQWAGKLYQIYPNENTAIIVNANKDADEMSETLHTEGIAHFKVSGQDLFATPTVKLILAHLNVLANEHNFIAWARLLKGIGVFSSNLSARNFIQSLFRHGLRPTDLLTPSCTSYIERFTHNYETQEFVVFDTETTGLDVFEDDIVQIAAVKIKQGKIVPQSQFNIFIATNKNIPEFLGEQKNPVFEVIQQQKLHTPQEALTLFMQYAEGYQLIGHNTTYDYNILEQNFRRYCPQFVLNETHPTYWDTLKLIRLIRPNLKQYKLEALIDLLQLEGKNSHLADEDVHATVGLINYCYQQSTSILQTQKSFMERPRVQECTQTFRRKYMECYQKAINRLYIRKKTATSQAIIEEIARFQNTAYEEKWIKNIPNIEYAWQYIATELIGESSQNSLAEQLAKHILEINTLKEADLCGSSVINERIFVTTIHKAKGLEFDNVIIFDAIEGRIPNFFNNNNARLTDEDARKFYVAMTRTKKRLFVSQCTSKISYRGEIIPCHITRFMAPIKDFFNNH